MRTVKSMLLSCQHMESDEMVARYAPGGTFSISNESAGG